VHSGHFYTNLYAAVGARAVGAREIGAVRNDVSHEVAANGSVLGRLCLRVPRVIAANSRAAIARAESRGIQGSRIRLLPNVVDTTTFRPSARPDDDRVMLLAVGRLVEQKRIDRFLSVVARVKRESRTPIRAIIAGDGPERSNLEAMAASLDLLPDTVEFRGNVASIGDVLRDADVLALTSEYEGTPNVVLEAMACGIPVVATPVGGVPDLIEHGVTGLLADGDTDALAEAVLALVGNRELRRETGARARDFVVRNHSIERLGVELAGLYTEALA
jgi:glycosyltransferase involved in cell wall biosynthesis